MRTIQSLAALDSVRLVGRRLCSWSCQKNKVPFWNKFFNYSNIRLKIYEVRSYVVNKVDNSKPVFSACPLKHKCSLLAASFHAARKIVLFFCSRIKIGVRSERESAMFFADSVSVRGHVAHRLQYADRTRAMSMIPRRLKAATSNLRDETWNRRRHASPLFTVDAY